MSTLPEQVTPRVATAKTTTISLDLAENGGTMEGGIKLRECGCVLTVFRGGAVWARR
jgi:hypothetical protein